jgi:hypothetical protein
MEMTLLLRIQESFLNHLRLCPKDHNFLSSKNPLLYIMSQWHRQNWWWEKSPIQNKVLISLSTFLYPNSCQIFLFHITDKTVILKQDTVPSSLYLWPISTSSIVWCPERFLPSDSKLLSWIYFILVMLTRVLSLRIGWFCCPLSTSFLTFHDANQLSLPLWHVLLYK